MKTVAQIKGEIKRRKELLLSRFPFLSEGSGIYVFTREENGFKYAYVGQAKHILSRIVQHFMGYIEHIDLSLKKHGVYSEENPCGWNIAAWEYPEEELDEREQENIRDYADKGFQLLNKTSGGQGKGKFGIAENRPAKGYREGLAQGYKNARRDVSKLFEKNLIYGINGTPNKRKQQAYDKFSEFLKSP